MSDHDTMRKALRAHLAWDIAERECPSKSTTFHQRMELCKYAQYLTRKALGEDAEYQGVPRIFLTPNPELVRATVDECEVIIDETFAAIAKAEAGQ